VSDKVTTQKLINLGEPITGAQIKEWHLSLKLLEEAHWEYDRVQDVMMPPGSKDLISE